MATLLVIHGPEPGRRYPLDKPVLRVGRDSSNSIQLLDNEVSRYHAEFRRDEEGYTVVDLKSSNGTHVNGRRVTQARLSSGDRIQVGQTVFVYGTGVTVARGDLAKKISMITQTASGRESAIVKSISQTEGSQYLAGPEAADAPWLQTALAQLKVLYETSLAVSHIVDLDELLARILELTFQSVRADRGCILLVDPDTKQYVCHAVHYRQGISSEEQIEISRTIVEYVLSKGEGVLTSDAATDERFTAAQSIMNYGIREAICVPMQGRHAMIGVIYLDNRRAPHETVVQTTNGHFTDDHLKMLVAIGRQAALAVEDTRFYQGMLQAERLAAVGQTIATLSHDIKNILQGIKGGSHLIEMGLSGRDEEQVRRGWNIVNKNQNKIYNLVMDMLTYSKEREPAFETSDLNEVAREVVELMEPRACEIGVDLRLIPDVLLPRISIDPEGIHRAVLNIASNALDATIEKEGGRVEVRTKYDPQQAVASVHVLDNGVGISREELPHLFAIFSPTKGARGTGIGLPVSEKIVHEHRGRILVRSQPGEGTEFIIELPAQANDHVDRKAPTLETSEL